MKISNLGEFNLIQRLTRNLVKDSSVIQDVGDDCAVVELPSEGRHLLLKSDSIIQDVHFTMAALPQQIGWKAMARPLSDIAAMGGTPRHALVNLAIPDTLDLEFVEKLYSGIRNAAEQFHTRIVGGDTTRSPDRIFISITLTGEIERERHVSRSGAKAGDVIFLTGELGGSILGRHLNFIPRLKEAKFLTSRFDIHAMMDVSDGLLSDLSHLLKASGVGAVLHAGQVPISREARELAQESTKSALDHALNDGEDFELLFTTGENDAPRLVTEWSREFSIPLSRIGVINGDSGSLKITDDQGNQMQYHAHGYDHFKQP